MSTKELSSDGHYPLRIYTPAHPVAFNILERSYALLEKVLFKRK